MKKGRIVNYHGRGRKKTAKISAQIRAVGAQLADLYMGHLTTREIKYDESDPATTEGKSTS
jgi:hypothetical protein